MTNQRINELAQDIDIFDYPASIIADNAMPDNTIYNYVSNTFLDGIINYVTVKDTYLHCVYEPTETITNIEKIRNKVENDIHTKLLELSEDNIVLFCITSNSYWVFYYDQDVSDCSIVRVSKQTFPCFNDFRDHYINYYKDDLLLQIPDPRGWVSS